MDFGADGEPVDALELGIGDGAHFFAATVGAHGIDPHHEPPKGDWVHLHVVVVAARGDLDKLARVGELGHWGGRLVGNRVALVISLDHDHPGDPESGRRVLRHCVGRAPGRLTGQQPVGFVETQETGPRREIDNLARGAIALVARAAVRVEHGTHVAVEAHRIVFPGRRGDVAWLARHGSRRCACHGRAAVALVTAQAAAALPGHDPGETAHGLQGAKVFVEQLEVQRDAAGRVEGHRPVELDGHGAHDALDAFGLDAGYHRAGGEVGALVPVAVGLVFDVEYAQVFCLAAKHGGRALIDVAAEDKAVSG